MCIGCASRPDSAHFVTAADTAYMNQAWSIGLSTWDAAGRSFGERVIRWVYLRCFRGFIISLTYRPPFSRPSNRVQAHMDDDTLETTPARTTYLLQSSQRKILSTPSIGSFQPQRCDEAHRTSESSCTTTSYCTIIEFTTSVLQSRSRR